MNEKDLLVTQKKVGKVIWENKLIEANDRVVVGLSGGKDSYSLLHILANVHRRVPFKFDIEAVHINVVNIPYDKQYEFMQKFCNNLSVKLNIVEIEVDLDRDKSLSNCFKCSWNRRTELFKFTNRNNYNKLALGHNLDDAVETLMLNMFYNAEISSIPYKVEMFQNKFQIIRPLLETQKQFIIEYSKIIELPEEQKTCPFAQESKRQEVRDMINQLEKSNKDFKKNIFRSMKKIVLQYLPQKQ